MLHAYEYSQHLQFTNTREISPMLDKLIIVSHETANNDNNNNNNNDNKK